MNAQIPTVPTTDLSNESKKNMSEAEVKIESEQPAEAPTATDEHQAQEERTWSEEIEVAGNQLVEKFKELIEEGNVRRLVFRTPDDSLLIEIPLVAGAVVGGVVTIFALPLAVLGAIASILARVKVEIVRVEEKTPTE